METTCRCRCRYKPLSRRRPKTPTITVRAEAQVDRTLQARAECRKAAVAEEVPGRLPTQRPQRRLHRPAARSQLTPRPERTPVRPLPETLKGSWEFQT